MSLSVVMLGDIVGRPGQRGVCQQAGALRERYNADLLIANAENAAGGSGLTPAIFHKLISYGVDGVTLGDHVYRQRDIVQLLETDSRIARPANLAESAAGKLFSRIVSSNGDAVYVITVLGRLSMNGPAADDPYACVDLLLDELTDAPVIVEIHAELTSEKQALGHYLDGRVAAVVGTHTHIPTADAKILPGGTAYITDLGMTGPYDSVLGRRKEAVIKFMTTSMPEQFGIAEGDIRVCGVHVSINGKGLADSIERVEAKADMSLPPFVGE